ncbi:MAG TPA: RluA family pseudouridine synthase [Anaerolineales bacterium]|nr:RluA family pseudouridine synthase [Anaerolineales bacterium]
MKIIHKDEHILVIDKPAGLSVLPDGWEKEAPYLLKTLEADHGKLWVVHRLDKTTSGVILFARDAEAHRDLNMQFEHHQAEKIYHAILQGNPRWNEKIAKHPLRVNVGHRHRTAVDNKNGKSSETRFKVIKRYQESALVEAQPMTGRAHQIRVHAYALGHPLLGDTLYSAEETNIITRPALHSHSLTIQVNGETVSFKAPYPDDFRTALDSFDTASPLRTSL